MQRWPWFTLVGCSAIAVSSLGRELIYNAFFSGEQLSRNIAQPIVWSGLLVMLAFGTLEWLIRRWRSRRSGV